MKAWQVTGAGEPRDVLRLAEVERPVAGPGQVLVRVRATAANFPDVLLCRGMYQDRPDVPFTPGVELCGEVVEVGPGVTTSVPGERVFGPAMLPDGGFAEFALLDARFTFPAAATLDDAEAAGFLIAYHTGWFALHHRTTLSAGETLLVHAAAGGVGSAAVQLGKAAGARVIAVVGGAEKVAVAQGLGADVVIDRRTEDVVATVKKATDGRGVDVVYDPVGGTAYTQSTKCIAFEGRILIIGFAGGEIPNAALNHVLIKNYSVIGLHWGLYRERDPGAITACQAALAELTSAGKLKPLVGERIGMADVPAGLQRLADGSSVGRVTLVI